MLMPNPLEAKNKVQIIKHLEVEDMVIIGSKNVDDKAFYAAKEIIMTVTAKRPEIRSKLTCLPAKNLRSGPTFRTRNFVKSYSGNSSSSIITSSLFFINFPLG